MRSDWEIPARVASCAKSTASSRGTRTIRPTLLPLERCIQLRDRRLFVTLRAALRSRAMCWRMSAIGRSGCR